MDVEAVRREILAIIAAGGEVRKTSVRDQVRAKHGVNPARIVDALAKEKLICQKHKDYWVITDRGRILLDTPINLVPSPSVSKMGGKYVPPSNTRIARPGAYDYLDCPSLIAGKAVPYAFRQVR